MVFEMDLAKRYGYLGDGDGQCRKWPQKRRLGISVWKQAAHHKKVYEHKHCLLQSKYGGISILI